MLAKTDNPADAEQPGSTIALWTEGGATDDKRLKVQAGWPVANHQAPADAGGGVHPCALSWVLLIPRSKSIRTGCFPLHILTGAGAGVDVCFPITAVLETALSKNPIST